MREKNMQGFKWHSISTSSVKTIKMLFCEDTLSAAILCRQHNLALRDLTECAE